MGVSAANLGSRSHDRIYRRPGRAPTVSPVPGKGGCVRILIATDYYPPFIGGAQIQSRLLAHNLRARGHEVMVVTVSQPALPSFERDGVDVYRVRHLRGVFHGRGAQSHHVPFPDPLAIVSLRRLIRRFRPDVVHSYGWISYSCALALARTRIPLLLTARDYGYGCANRTLLRDGRPCEGAALLKCLGCAGRNYGRPKGWLAAVGVLASRRLLRRKAEALHCVSTYVEEIMHRDFLDHAGPAVPSHVVPDVVDTAAAQLAPGEVDDDSVAAILAQLPDEPFILFVGALRRIKGMEELLDAYQRLGTTTPLVLIGTMEPDSPRVFPAGVRVITDAPQPAVLQAWERSLFGVFPSLFAEPFGTVVAEAMSRGRPVIGTGPSGHSDMIVEGETGLLVPRGDVEALAAAMRSLLDDSCLRERLGRAALSRSRRFTVETSLPILEQVLAGMLARRSVS
jgi:glycosyltransferase involved in cell wall biosynthesis